jgi:hypothetical protein
MNLNCLDLIINICPAIGPHTFPRLHIWEEERNEAKAAEEAKEEAKRVEEFSALKEKTLKRHGPPQPLQFETPHMLALVPKFARDQYPEAMAKWGWWIKQNDEKMEASINAREGLEKKGNKKVKRL